MPSGNRVMKKFNIFGLIIILIGVALLLSALGILILPDTLSVWDVAWPALLIICGLGAFASAKRFTFWGAGLTLVGLYFLLANLEVITVLPKGIVWAAIVILLGLAIFLPSGGNKKAHVHHEGSSTVETDSAGNVRASARFSSDKRTVGGECFTGANISSNFGGVELDLRGFHTTAPNAVIDLNVTFGGVTLWLPHGARVERSNLNCTLGGLEIKGTPAPGAVNISELKGSVSFGGVEISYPVH